MRKYPKSIAELEQELYSDFIHFSPPPVSDPPPKYSDLDEWIRYQWSELTDESLIQQLSEYLVELRYAIKRNIEEAGHRAYMAYMHSPEWESLRSACLKRDNFKCSFCGGEAIQAHHACGYDFDRSFGEELAGLQAVCWDCHAKHEQKERMNTKGKPTFYRRQK